MWKKGFLGQQLSVLKGVEVEMFVHCFDKLLYYNANITGETATVK